MKITKQIREHAVMLASAAACNPDVSRIFEQMCAAHKMKHESIVLVADAFAAVDIEHRCPECGTAFDAILWAEAEAKLREGFTE